MSYCSQCGAQLNPDENFCHKCGHPVEEEASGEGLPPIPVTPPASLPPENSTVATPSSAAAPPVLPTAQKQGGFNISRGCLRIGLIVLAAFVALAFIIVVAVVSMTSGPVVTVEAHLEALKEGSMDAAFEHTSAGFRSNMNKEQYRQFILNYPILRSYSGTSFPERSLENQMAKLKGTVVLSDGREFPLAVDLVKESDEWKILTIDFRGLPVSSGGQPDVQSDDEPEQAQSDSTASSVGTISVGAGRDSSGNLVNPGSPVPSESPTISANVELINHPADEKVEVWLQYEDPAYKTGVTDVEISGAGNGTFAYDIELPGAPPGKWTVQVRLAGEKMFSHAFEIK
ncbi:MAG: DUF4864 domain-containing protein [Verrucomicrobiales bacterium]|nr:DUF4864 domain-containing protein [Verrucomicrobiales bacterium]